MSGDGAMALGLARHTAVPCPSNALLMLATTDTILLFFVARAAGDPCPCPALNGMAQLWCSKCTDPVLGSTGVLYTRATANWAAGGCSAFPSPARAPRRCAGAGSAGPCAQTLSYTAPVYTNHVPYRLRHLHVHMYFYLGVTRAETRRHAVLLVLYGASKQSAPMRLMHCHTLN